jgi:cell wall assembly regulator SMI1
VTTPFGVDQRGPMIDDARIARFEAKLGYRLPPSFRRFLLEINGCVPAEENTVLPVSGGSVVLQVLYGLDCPDDWMDVEYALELMQLREEGAFPSDALPIGNDGFGNGIVLSLAGGTAGQVYYQNLSEFPTRPRETEWYRARQFEKVADTFDEFIATLRPLELTT